ncbi:MAG: hybrid sensor histidine kinase/response regulator [Planctomycetota bacterium]
MEFLVVDDDRWSQQVLQKMLETRGHAVRLADDGEQALAMIEESTPDVVISDIMMPHVDGFQLCRRLREHREFAATPIVLLSACYREQRDKQLARAAGATFYLEKPLRRSDLDAVLEQIARIASSRDDRPVGLDLLLPPEEFAERHQERLVSKLHEYALEITRAHEKLKRLDEAKDTFVAIASHELRTPIAVLSGYCRLLAHDLGESAKPEMREFLSAMEVATERLCLITRRLLQMSQLQEEGGLDLPREPLDLESICREVMGELAPFIKARSQAAEVVVASALPRVPGVAWSIRQTVVELLQNAVKFTPDGGLIRIELRRQDPVAVMRVSDNGIGIPEAERERVFEKFYEVGGPDKHTTGTFEFRAGGLGLGLSLARAVILEHNGVIRIESREDGSPGTVVHVEIPLRLESQGG